VNLGIRGKHFVTSFLLTMSAVIVAGLYLESALGDWLENRIDTELTHLARSGQGFLQRFEGTNSITEMDALADVLGTAAEVRITIIANNGEVLGDSTVPIEMVDKMDNHGKRPEFILAKKNGVGHSKRYSKTIGTNMLYVGIPFWQSNDFSGVIRAAMSLKNVDNARLHLRWVLLLAILLAGGAAASLSGLTAHFATRKLRLLVNHAQELIPSHPPANYGQNPVKDEIAGLTGSFDHIARELEIHVDDLGRERDRMNALLHGLVEGVVALDSQNRITMINSSAATLLNLPQSVVGSIFWSVVTAPELTNFIKQCRKTGKNSSLELGWTGPPLRQLSIWFATVQSNDEWILVLRDITEIRHLEQVRKDFVANVSHELRTPISVIQANAETLANSAKNDPETSMLLVNAMERNAQRVSRIITNLLEISRLEADNTPLDLEPVNLAHAIERVVEIITTTADDNQVKLVVEVEEELWVQANVGALNQVLFNLVENAIKYVTSGSWVKISNRAEKNHRIRLEVTDNGSGVPEQHRSRIFERFYRVDTGRSRKMGGTGLGLAIVKHMVEKMDGTVGMEPIEPNGSCFWLELRSEPENSEQPGIVNEDNIGKNV
jgi:two-component system, OmpR family, phosphate regulon sensor histidine kinase PhoR